MITFDPECTVGHTAGCYSQRYKLQFSDLLEPRVSNYGVEATQW